MSELQGEVMDAHQIEMYYAQITEQAAQYPAAKTHSARAGLPATG